MFDKRLRSPACSTQCVWSLLFIVFGHIRWKSCFAECLQLHHCSVHLLLFRRFRTRIYIIQTEIIELCMKYTCIKTRNNYNSNNPSKFNGIPLYLRAILPGIFSLSFFTEKKTFAIVVQFLWIFFCLSFDVIVCMVLYDSVFFFSLSSLEHFGGYVSNCMRCFITLNFALAMYSAQLGVWIGSMEWQKNGEKKMRKLHIGSETEWKVPKCYKLNDGHICVIFSFSE